MHRSAVAVFCLLFVFTLGANCQKAAIPPLTIPTGTVLEFHLQTRFNPEVANEIDALPKDTIFQVRLLTAIDSGLNRDGSDFAGEVVSPVVCGKQVVVRAGSEAHGILALLRNREHPDGFRYELLLTGIRDHQRSFDLTASLNASLAANENDERAEHAKPDAREAKAPESESK